MRTSCMIKRPGSTHTHKEVSVPYYHLCTKKSMVLKVKLNTVLFFISYCGIVSQER